MTRRRRRRRLSEATGTAAIGFGGGFVTHLTLWCPDPMLLASRQLDNERTSADGVDRLPAQCPDVQDLLRPETRALLGGRRSAFHLHEPATQAGGPASAVRAAERSGLHPADRGD